MSFSMTTQQIYDRTKTVTRRFAWWGLRPGVRIQACVKCMGLKKGETIEKLAVIEVVKSTNEALDAISKDECAREGFPDMEPAEFVEMLLSHNKGKIPRSTVNRIEFKYIT